MTTSKQALAAARRRWGKRAFVRENKRAMTKAQRDERKSHLAAISERRKAAEAERDSLRHDWLALLKAAEFVLDVDADPHALDALRKAAECSRLYVDLQDEIRLLRSEHENLRGGLHSQRWEAGYVGTIPGLSDYLSVGCQADTIDELLAKIEPAQEHAR